MPLKNIPLPSIDAALDEDVRKARQQCERLCAESRREWERKNAFVCGLVAVCVAALVLVAYLKWGG